MKFSSLWLDNWEKNYRQEISRDVKDKMILKILGIIVQDLKTIKIALGEEE